MKRLYTLADLGRATGYDHRTCGRFLERAGVDAFAITAAGAILHDEAALEKLRDLELRKLSPQPSIPEGQK